MKNISPLYKFSLKGGGWDEQRQPKMQPSAEIVRVECAKRRRECDVECATYIHSDIGFQLTQLPRWEGR